MQQTLLLPCRLGHGCVAHGLAVFFALRALHDAGVSAWSIEVGPDGAAPVLRFVQELRRRHVRGAGVDAALRALLLLAPPGILIAWLLPPLRWPMSGGLALLVVGHALLAALRARRVTAARLLHGAGNALGCDRLQVAELGDELATWIELQDAGKAPSLMPWLTTDVAARVPKLTTANLAPVGRRPFGDLLWLLPLLLLLLLAWLLAEWLAPPWSGLLGGGGGHSTAAGDGGAAGRGSDGPGDEAPQPGDQAEPAPPSERQPSTLPPPPPEPDTPPPEPPAETDPKPPPPLLELPLQQQFLLPEFLADGPTRRMRMHAAELETGVTPRTQQQSRTDEAKTTNPPLPSPEEFQRAAEAALRDRHVPPAERPMVRRFFEALQRAAK